MDRRYHVKILYNFGFEDKFIISLSDDELERVHRTIDRILENPDSSGNKTLVIGDTVTRFIIRSDNVTRVLILPEIETFDEDVK